MIRIRAKFANLQQTSKRQRVTNWFGGVEPGSKIRTFVVCPKYRTIVRPWKFFLSCWPSAYYRCIVGLALHLLYAERSFQRPSPAGWGLSNIKLVPVIGLNMNLKEILADPGISYWLKDAIKTAYERDPIDAMHDARRLLKMLGEWYTQMVNRDRTAL